MTVHSILPEPLTRAITDVFAAAGVRHVEHGAEDPVEAASAAVGDLEALALVGPYRSADDAAAVARATVAPATIGDIPF